MSFRSAVETSTQANTDQPFLTSGRHRYSYGEALAITDRFAALTGGFDHMAVISNSGDISYLSVFSAVLLGATFMHLNIDWHENRLADVLAQATPDIVVCHSDWAEAHAQMLGEAGYAKLDIPAGEGGIMERMAIYRKGPAQPDHLSAYKAKKKVDDLLYVMFTSGSTGQPKGVPVSTASANCYARAMIEACGIGPRERWLQPVDLHFDVSMMTVLSAWLTGGHIIAIPSKQSPFGPRFVKKFAPVENWTSVPSVIARASALGMLGAGSMPGLKRSFFCGEALPSDMAAQWQAAAPDATIYNLYGPTEATIALTWHRFNSAKDSQRAITPIGIALRGSKARLAEDGEIELGGPQVFHGYLGNPKPIKTYLETDADGTRWYKTGDIGEMDADGTLHFKGRKDWQVKLRGYRVEIEEVEAVIRKRAESALVAVVPAGAVSGNSYERLCAFIGTEVDAALLKAALHEALPDYMVPSDFVALADFPRNANGKIDRNALVALAEAL